MNIRIRTCIILFILAALAAFSCAESSARQRRRPVKRQKKVIAIPIKKNAPLPTGLTYEAAPLAITKEALPATPEAKPLLIKGSQSITFNSQTIEGSKDGFAPGSTFSREENLRLNISGKAAGTDIDATFIRTSAIGVAEAADNDQKISIILRRASTEAYLGDFSSDLNETEFTKLNKVLSGAKIKGNYDKWGFTALYSSPKGDSKFLRQYGDNTQGPFKLDSSPVVIDSERVLIDGVRQKRGDDYNIDYQAGTITFIKRTIDIKSILQVYYDYRQTVYDHSTYGLRTYIKPAPNIKLGVSYLNDSDSLAGAQDIRNSMTAEAVNPQSHYVAGVDAGFSTDNISAEGEFAYSLKNLNILSPSGTLEAGKAARVKLKAGMGPLELTGYAKKIGAQFFPVADPDPRQDLWEYDYGFKFSPDPVIGAEGSYKYAKYMQSGVLYENKYKTAKAKLAPGLWPSLEYNFSESDESNDPVTGSLIMRSINRNSLETDYKWNFLSASCKGTIEKWTNHSPTEETTIYKRVNVGLATAGIDKFTLTTNYEIERRTEPTGLNPTRRTYNLNLSAAPSKALFFSSAIQAIDDTATGSTNVTDLTYRFQPSDVFRTEGKYSISSVTEDFPLTPEGVSKQVGSFSIDLRPVRAIKLRYMYKPSFSLISRTGTPSYSDLQQQAEINLAPFPQVSAGLIYKLGDTFSVYKQDYPNYTIKEKTGNTDSSLYTLKMAPIPILSIEFNYLLEHSLLNTIAVTQEPVTYTTTKGLNRQFDAAFRTSLSEKFALDSRFTYQKQDQGSGEGTSDALNTKTYSGSLKGTWNLTNSFSFSVSGAFTRTTDYLFPQVTYTVSPGFGFIYRQGDRLRVDFDYAYTKSYAGAATEKMNYSLKTKYGISDFVNVMFQAMRETSVSPDYRMTQITGNIEINL